MAMKKIKLISTRDHALIKQAYKLQRPKERRKQQLFVAEGWRACTTLLENGAKLQTLLITNDALTQLTDLFVPHEIFLVADHVMEKTSSATTPSGVLGIFNIPQTDATDLKESIVLAGVSDPGNMGTLIRTAAAMNIKQVIVIDGCDPYAPKVVQASAGTIAQVSIVRLSIEQVVAQKKDTSLCALVVADGSNPADINFANTALVVGSEAHGIPAELLDQCDQKMTLPMPGNTESLNAAIAGSIAMYLMKQ